MPAGPSCIIEPIWNQVAALLPPRQVDHPLGCRCHRPRVSDRVVFVLRAVEGLSTAEVAAALELQEGAVKVRLHRARERLKKDLLARAERAGALGDAWTFDGPRCDGLVARVFRSARVELG